MIFMSNKNDKTAFQLGMDAVSKIAHPRKHAQGVEANLEANQGFLGAFSAAIERASLLGSQSSADSLKPLLDEIRYSDPVSTEASSRDESILLELAKEVLDMVINNLDIPEDVVDRMRKLLAARNNVCKGSK